MNDNENKSINDTKEKVLGLFWTFGERSSPREVSLYYVIILARILLPSEYGIIAMVMVLLILQMSLLCLQDLALVQRRCRLDFSLYFCTLSLIYSYFILYYLLEPHILPEFYHTKEIILVLRIFINKDCIIINSNRSNMFRRE